MAKPNKFKLLNLHELTHVTKIIKKCQKGNHVQQVAYSTYHNGLTQICFTCRTIITSIKKEDIS